MMRIFFRLPFCLLLVMVGACGTITPLAPEDVVARRAQDRWDALIKGDIDAAYAYLSPAYRRMKSLESYKRGIFGVGIWQKAEVDRVVCERLDVCSVTVLVTTRLALPRIGTPMESTTPVYERWIRERDQWWYVPKR